MLNNVLAIIQPLSAKLKPIELVQILDKLYSAFDRFVEDCCLWKMDTIGDAYVVVAVVDHPDQMGELCRRMAHLGHFMIQVLASFRASFPEYDLQMRIGVHAGRALAGVVGDLMPRYHIYGKTLLKANKLESTGVPGKLHVSREVYMFLQECWEIYGDEVDEDEAVSFYIEHVHDCDDLSFLRSRTTRLFVQNNTDGVWGDWDREATKTRGRGGGETTTGISSRMD